MLWRQYIQRIRTTLFPNIMLAFVILFLLQITFTQTRTLTSLFGQQATPKEWSPKIKMFEKTSRIFCVRSCLAYDDCAATDFDIQSEACQLLGNYNSSTLLQNLDSTRWETWKKQVKAVILICSCSIFFINDDKMNVNI